mmetsp:Transcript_41666/g.126123  ORF Transcript_41666/g.126123 Transcript_41666/m.126123 type:complete len:336 (+) Transcript_41666:518-1525(+)
MASCRGVMRRRCSLLASSSSTTRSRASFCRKPSCAKALRMSVSEWRSADGRSSGSRRATASRWGSRESASERRPGSCASAFSSTAASLPVPLRRRRGTCCSSRWKRAASAWPARAKALATRESCRASICGAAAAALRAAVSLGETIIVTNGRSTWVEESSRYFLPGLVPALERLHVVSARAWYECEHPDDPFAWKRRAFHSILQGHLAAGGGAAGLNLVVLGDSFAEIQAAEYLVAGDVSGAALLKTVKFKESPSAGELIGQLQAMVLELQAVVAAARSVSTMLMQAHTRKGGWVLGDPSVIVPKEHFDEVEMLSSCLRGLQVGAWQRFQVAAAL